ncbi:MAG TPA: hypothetical protein VNO75_08620 [Gemmatimonadaceae bacterium]|nr:hypothetical protein [Gemmatimonadaceae bacterium]
MILKCLVLALTGVALGSPRPSSFGQQIKPYQITDVRVHLFYSREGTFSGNLVGTQNMNSLWNTVIGEGQGGGASSATLVVVEVSGEPGSYGGESSVELGVRGTKREILRRRQSLGVLSDKGNAYVGFWLYDTGCEPLRTSAKLVGKTKSTPVSVEIPFRCGE